MVLAFLDSSSGELSAFGESNNNKKLKNEKKKKRKRKENSSNMLLDPDGEKIVNHEMPSKCATRTARHRLGL